MNQQPVAQFEIVVIGSGEAGKYLAWTLASSGLRTAMVERSFIGGSCPNIACLPSKNVIHSAKVASLARHAGEFGLEGLPLTTSMEGVRRRKREMVDGLVELHLSRFKDSGVQLIMGDGRLAGSQRIQVRLSDGSDQVISAEKIFLNLGTRASIPNVRGLTAAVPMTHIEALELDRVPEHLIVLGGGYFGLELAQAMRRFGARVTVIERGKQLLRREDLDVADALSDLFRAEGIDVILDATVLNVEGRSGQEVSLKIQAATEERTIVGTDLLVAAGRLPNTSGVGLEEAGVDLDSRGYVKVNDRLETRCQGFGRWATAPEPRNLPTLPSTTSGWYATISAEDRVQPVTG